MHDFVLGRKAATRLLRVSQLAIHGDFKHSATGLPQGHLRGWLRLSDQICRLTGARFVTSHSAVFDLDLHEGSSRVVDTAGRMAGESKLR